MANIVNLETVRGDDFSLTFSFTDPVYNEPIDITGWTLYLTIKDKISREDDDALFQKDVSVHSDPANGKTSITITHTESFELKNVYPYDVQIKTDDNVVKTIMIGNIKFIEDVTRRY